MNAVVVDRGVLTEHFTWEEACITNVRNVPNDIPTSYEGAIRNTAKQMERVRALLLDKRIVVSSWYRSPEVNAAVGGSKHSQHMRGEAVDFISPQYGTPLEIVRKIAKYPELIKFDQLILEHSWVHISFNPIPHVNPRSQVLTLLSSGSYAQGITDKLGNPA